jgi:hypothetical protein
MRATLSTTAHRPLEEVVPSENAGVAGYSTTGSAKKLGIKPGSTLVLCGADESWTVADLPDDVTVVRVELAEPPDAGTAEMVTIAFARSQAELDSALEVLARSIYPAGALWVAWPRRAGGHTSDITDNTIRAAALALGIVDVKVAAIDDDWSGLRFVWRKELRSGCPGRVTRPI